MNRDDIICLAAEAGFSRYQFGGMFDVYLERFAVLIAKEEREKCAQIAEGFQGDRDLVPGSLWGNIRSEVAAAIRARKDAA